MSDKDAYKAELATYLQHFGATVRRLRTAGNPGLSQERLASITDLHRTEIGKIELGQVEPRLTTLIILADGLTVTMDELVADLWVPTWRKPPQAKSRL